MNTFHFLRPIWLLGLPLLILLLVWLWRRQARGHWSAACDPQLLAHLLLAEGNRPGSRSLVAIGLSGLLALLALAGPVWHKLPEPVFQDRSALVLVLDLSRSMDAADLPPSRLARARLKLLDILAGRKEGETALIAYAATPFVITPLTDDTATVANLVQSLTTDLIPVQGSRADRAVAKAVELLRQDGDNQGDILLITDGATEAAAQAVRGTGFRLSVLGVGTAQGAPVPLSDGGFLKDAHGAIVLPRLDETALEEVAREGGGRYYRMRADDQDTHALLAAFHPNSPATASRTDRRADRWREEGPWLLLPLLPLAALAFRRGLLVLPLVLLIGIPGPAHAFGWRDLWLRGDQQAAQALTNGHPDTAAKLFHDRRWQAAAHYRAGQYEEALKSAKGLDGPQDWYNRGNALAQLGKLQEAIKAYDQALARDPKLADAKYNRDLIRKRLEQQQKQQQDQQKQQQGKDQQKQESPNQPSNPDASQKNGKGATGSPSSADQKQGQKSSGNSAQAEQPKNDPSPSTSPSDKGGKDDKSGKGANSSEKSKSDSNSDTQQATSDQAGKTEQKPDAGKPGQAQAAQPTEQPPADGQHAKQAPVAADDEAVTESKQAEAQWLRRIPDDPGGLLRRKFLYQYQQQYGDPSQGEQQPW